MPGLLLVELMIALFVLSLMASTIASYQFLIARRQVIALERIMGVHKASSLLEELLIRPETIESPASIQALQPEMFTGDPVFAQGASLCRVISVVGKHGTQEVVLATVVPQW